jgi:hypothetical protein
MRNLGQQKPYQTYGAVWQFDHILVAEIHMTEHRLCGCYIDNFIYFMKMAAPERLI